MPGIKPFPLSLSLQRSSRGRTIKPVLASFKSTCTNLFGYGYSYSGSGDVTGINSSVIDLTLDDCTLNNDELSISSKVKKESKKEAIVDSTDEEGSDFNEKPTRRKKERKMKPESNKESAVRDSTSVPDLPLACNKPKLHRSPKLMIPRVKLTSSLATKAPAINCNSKKRRSRITMPQKKKANTESEGEETSSEHV